MALSPFTLVLVGLFVVASAGATALIPMIDKSCSEFINGEDPNGPMSGGKATTEGNCGSYPDPCPGGETNPYPSESTEPTGVVRFEIHNEKRPVEARFCLADPDGIKRFDVTRKIATNATLLLDLELPVDVYEGGFRIEGDRMVSTYQNLDVGDCPDHAVLITARVGHEFFGGLSAGVTSPQCIDRPQRDTDNPLYPMGTQSGDPPLIGPPVAQDVQMMAATVAVASGGFLAIAALLRWDRLRWMLAFFFTRIHPPKALDHRLREEIQGLVQERPGLRAEDIRKVLELGHGQTAHHVRILIHAKILEALRISGSHHFYPAGRYGHQEKRRLALLNLEAAKRLYDLIRKTGECDISTLAKNSRLSVAYVSRLAARLAAEGLVERRRDGNRVVLCVENGI